jgi:hypothetical protein
LIENFVINEIKSKKLEVLYKKLLHLKILILLKNNLQYGMPGLGWRKYFKVKFLKIFSKY